MCHCPASVYIASVMKMWCTVLCENDRCFELLFGALMLLVGSLEEHLDCEKSFSSNIMFVFWWIQPKLVWINSGKLSRRNKMKSNGGGDNGESYYKVFFY